jgi:mRNA-degrading endonuclease RelE of RelBE toxin-antitoxin system
MWGDWEGLWRLKIGEYRAIYDIQDRAALVTIRRIRHRSQVYELPLG